MGICGFQGNPSDNRKGKCYAEVVIRIPLVLTTGKQESWELDRTINNYLEQEFGPALNYALSTSYMGDDFKIDRRKLHFPHTAPGSDLRYTIGICCGNAPNAETIMR